MQIQCIYIPKTIIEKVVLVVFARCGILYGDEGILSDDSVE